MTAIRLRPTSQHLAYPLPLFMGVIEYIVRVALKQPGANEFFPISLVASGISINMALAALPTELLHGPVFWQLGQRLERAIFIASLGIFASLGGVLLWLYLLIASFNEDVRALLPLHPLIEASAYYGLSVYLTVCKDKEVTCWNS
ncbi:hypothetical protein [Caballeronia sp. ATUFL_M2_KS44]|uniref:hypothetical protein n=1 Tax=Caballeronia sp. ATUFL_M2_KS44 TaxID=2921767 RepID=UPI002028CCBA|nr:hypothetical protein [Caballeronia sp. ATUFL_M2_KS44]